MITYLKNRFNKIFRRQSSLIVISERQNTKDTSYSYEKHMDNDFNGIISFYDMEAVIYTMTDLKCFGYVFYKVKNENFCKCCSNAKWKHVIRIVTGKLIPLDVQSYIQENQGRPATEVMFTTGSVNTSRSF